MWGTFPEDGRLRLGLGGSSERCVVKASLGEGGSEDRWGRSPEAERPCKGQLCHSTCSTPGTGKPAT